MRSIGFEIEKKGELLARAGILRTRSGELKTPSFVAVGTKGTVKALTPEMVESSGVRMIIANAYHLSLEPGSKNVSAWGGIGKMMNWPHLTMTDSGGFQVFSLGGKKGARSKVATRDKKEVQKEEVSTDSPALLKITEDGVTFRSPKDGSVHELTPERSMGIQHDLGANIMFAFDECASPEAPFEYQKEAMERTHRWAKRSLDFHGKANTGQALFGIVQGGRHEELRRESARTIGKMDFDGFGIGGSFEKQDMGNALRWVAEELPETKPRHLLGIGEPEDLFLAVENGADTFDCVTPTRMARNGGLYTHKGKINIANAQYRNDTKPIDEKCDCYACGHFTKAYLAHLFRSDELLAYTLASVHNLRFITKLVGDIRNAVLDDSFQELKKNFLSEYTRD